MYENKVVERSIGIINFNTKCLFLDAPLCCCCVLVENRCAVIFFFTMVGAAVVVLSVSKSIIVDVDNN